MVEKLGKGKDSGICDFDGVRFGACGLVLGGGGVRGIGFMRVIGWGEGI